MLGAFQQRKTHSAAVSFRLSTFMRKRSGLHLRKTCCLPKIHRFCRHNMPGYPDISTWILLSHGSTQPCFIIDLSQYSWRKRPLYRTWPQTFFWDCAGQRSRMCSPLGISQTPKSVDTRPAWNLQAWSWRNCKNAVGFNKKCGHPKSLYKILTKFPKLGF